MPLHALSEERWDTLLQAHCLTFTKEPPLPSNSEDIIFIITVDYRCLHFTVLEVTEVLLVVCTVQLLLLIRLHCTCWLIWRSSLLRGRSAWLSKVTMSALVSGPLERIISVLLALTKYKFDHKYVIISHNGMLWNFCGLDPFCIFIKNILSCCCWAVGSVDQFDIISCEVRAERCIDGVSQVTLIRFKPHTLDK